MERNKIKNFNESACAKCAYFSTKINNCGLRGFTYIINGEYPAEHTCSAFSTHSPEDFIIDDEGYFYWKDLCENKENEMMTKADQEEQNNKLYILCNRRLSSIYASIQGGHALSLFVKNNPNIDVNNLTLIYLSCNLQHKKEEMDEHGYEYTEWKEVDLGNSITAIACLGDKDLLFTRLKTLQ